ncbi:Succinate--CoA ligase [Clarias magur]|uniref:Succinate--CoA ligase n=1 Tax=Clarias magur TaxID=1594786 RepID=A0A8J4U6A3_CLAMG|nr:Succinate--CoA ligase [Clarias magur]
MSSFGDSAGSVRVRGTWTDERGRKENLLGKGVTWTAHAEPLPLDRTLDEMQQT